MKIIIPSWTVAFKIWYLTTCPSFRIDTIKGLKMFRISKIYNSLLSYVWWIKTGLIFQIIFMRMEICINIRDLLIAFVQTKDGNDTLERSNGWTGEIINKWWELLTHLPSNQFCFSFFRYYYDIWRCYLKNARLLLC